MRQLLYTLALIHIACACPNQTPPSDERKVQHVSALSRSPTEIDVYWDAGPTSDNAPQQFEVTVTPGDRQPIITAERHATVELLNASTEYEFHVYLRHKNGTRQEPGVKATATTFGSVEENPTNGTAVALNTTTIRLKWEAVERSERKTPLYTIVIDRNTTNVIRTNETTYDITNLSPFTNYMFQVYSTKSDGSWYLPGIFLTGTTKPEVAELSKETSKPSPPRKP